MICISKIFRYKWFCVHKNYENNFLLCCTSHVDTILNVQFFKKTRYKRNKFNISYGSTMQLILWYCQGNNICIYNLPFQQFGAGT